MAQEQNSPLPDFDINFLDALLNDQDTEMTDVWGGIEDADMLAAMENMPVFNTPAYHDLVPASPAASEPDPEPDQPNDPDPFPKLSEQDLLDLEGAKDEKSTKSSTNWGVNRLKGNISELFFVVQVIF